MSPMGKWDLTSTHSLESYAEWTRANAAATVVMIVRGGDYALAVVPGIRPQDAQEAVEFVLGDAVRLMGERLKAKQEAAMRKRAAEITGRV